MDRNQLWNQIVSGEKNPFMVAEIGVNHENDIEIAKTMIDKAFEAGADAVKFQTYKAERLACRNSPAYWNTEKESITSQYELFKKHDHFGESEYRELAQYCMEKGITFLSTPFDQQAVDFLDELLPIFKIASSDITNLPFIKYIAQKKKPIFLSTGASTLGEIEEALSVIQAEGNTHTVIMHCVLSYPTDFENANLNMIRHLQTVFPDRIIGYSDHTVADDHMLVLTTAFLLGARVLEKHFTLDKKLPGNDHYHAMDPSDLRKFRENISQVKKMGGEYQKRVLPCEENSRKYARRSIVANQTIPIGTFIEAHMLTQKRPGIGIPPKFLQDIIGRKAKRPISEDDIIRWDMLE